MSKTQTVHLGFEVGTGEPVSVPITHLCVTGQTQLSGKTTTLEAMVARSGMKAIAFVTKRGEGVFSMPNAAVDKVSLSSSYHVIRPYFHHRADWQFVSDILGAILSEKLKFQRPWIMKVCRGAKNIRDVQANVQRALKGDKQRKIKAATGLAESVYTELEAYFELLLPELERLPYSDTLELSPGLNVMDLSDYSTALQMLVVSSVLEEIYRKYKGVITVIPEAWEFVPGGKSSPAKSAAINLIRKGAVLRNFIWLDSQDLASIDTEVRRACGVWILGVQREQNEVKRAISHIPAGTKRPKLEDVMHLERGEFFVCHGREVQKVYVQPAWMPEDIAKKISTGEEPEWERPSELSSKSVFGEGPASFTVTRVNSVTGATAPGHADPSTVVVNDHRMSDVFARDPAADIAIGDPIVDIDSRYERGQIGFQGIDYVQDESCPQDKFTLARRGGLRSNYDEDPPYDRDRITQMVVDAQSYNAAPSGTPFLIDDGGNTVDQQERVLFQRQIDGIMRVLYRTLKGTSNPGSAGRLTYEDWRKEIGDDFGLEPDPDAVTPRYVEIAHPFSDEQSESVMSELRQALLCDDAFMDRLVAEAVKRMPANGVIKVAPREVILKKFQTEEVDRILEIAAARSVFQKRVIQLLEAKAIPMQKAAIVTALTGRKTVNMQRDFKDQYAEIDELAGLGFVRKDPKNGIYPYLGVGIKKRIAEFEPSDNDIDQIIGQVMLRLN